MNTIKDEKRNNIFGALKMIEKLYLDGQIPGYVFRNIIKEYSGTVSVSDFICHKEKPPPESDGAK